MSSQPAPIISSAAFVPVGDAPVALASSRTGAPTDYGPVGTVPGGAGVRHFEEAAEKHNQGKPKMFAGVSAFVIGVVLMALGEFMPVLRLMSLLIVFPAIYMFFSGWRAMRRASHHDFVCDDDGMTLRESERGKPQPSTLVPWSKVTATAWLSYRRSTNPKDMLAETVPAFQFNVTQQNGTILEIDESDLANVDALVECVNEHAPQLAYRWVPAERGDAIEKQVGKYARVAR